VRGAAAEASNSFHCSQLEPLHWKYWPAQSLGTDLCCAMLVLMLAEEVGQKAKKLFCVARAPPSEDGSCRECQKSWWGKGCGRHFANQSWKQGESLC